MSESFVLDASALLCLLFQEAGADRVEAILEQACIGAVNYCEVVSKVVERGVPYEALIARLDLLSLDVVPLDRATAERAGLLRAETRKAGLSLGDRCCLALARQRQAVAVTTDRVWSTLALGVSVEVVR